MLVETESNSISSRIGEEERRIQKKQRRSSVGRDGKQRER